jgi:aminomethyltransferase
MNATPARQAAAVRSGAGLFRRSDRGVFAVEGADRVRWLDGMLTADVGALGPEHSGCYALLLTPKGRIVADLHLLQRGDALWAETAAPAVGPVLARLQKYVIADDVLLSDIGASLSHLSLEGPRATEVLERALAAAPVPRLAADTWGPVTLAGEEVALGAWSTSGEAGFQILAPVGAGDAVAEALRVAGGDALVEAGPEAFEILRVEAGIPRLGAELGEDVLPAEARLLERAVSFSKGCYTGQEIVARVASQGQVAHLLVGFRFEHGRAPAPDAEVRVGERVVGEVTSACQSALVGAIGLGFVRRQHAEPGSEVQVEGRPARVVSLPFVEPSAKQPA